jgi:hypothetical protein
MAAEREIMNKMKTATMMFSNLLNQIKVLKTCISKDIDLNMDNNYFIEKTDINDKFNAFFDDQTIDNLLSIIEPFVDELVTERDRVCENHEYIQDSIDDGPDKSKTIYYCRVCHVSRKSEQ